MVSHQPTKFGSHRHGGSGVMFVVVEGQDSACPRLDPSFLFMSTAHGMPCFHKRNFKT